MNSSKKKLFSIYVEIDDLNKLKEIAYKKDSDVSKIIRRLIKEYISSQSK